MSATIIAIVYANGQLAEYVAGKHPADFASYIRSATVAEWTSAITGDSKGWANWAQKYKAAGTAIVGYLMGGATVPSVPGPSPVGNWLDRLNGAIVLCGAPNYYWHKQSASQREAILDAVAASGCDGLHFEFGGEFIVQEYIGKPMSGTFADIYRQRIADFAPWIAGIRARGLIAEVTWINTNQSKANGLDVSGHAGLVNQFLNTHGTDNMLILPYSETDKRTTRHEAVLAAFRARVPGGQLIRYASGQPGAWFETHPSSIAKVTGSASATTIICSDSGGIIKELKGASWTVGGTTNTANMAKFSQACKRVGASCAEYSFAREFDPSVPVILASAYQRSGWNAPLANGPENGPRIVSMSADGGTAKKPYIKFKLAGVDHWKNNSKGVNAWIVINGVRCENIREGYTRQHLGNAYGTGEHSVAVNKGETVSIRFEKIDKRTDKTQDVPLKWVWDSTR